MSSKEIGRRDVLKWGAVGAVAVTVSSWRGPAGGAPTVIPEEEGDMPDIRARSNYGPGQWFFDPVGLYIERGQRVRWVGTKWGVSVTAFHPENYNHELRIPKNAKPFDSGLLAEGNYRNTFEWTFDVEGTYDYFSRNHEILGMVGRIVVGKPGGDAEKPPGYGTRQGRAVVFPAQARVLSFVSSRLIVDEKVLRYPPDLVVREFPFSG